MAALLALAAIAGLVIAIAGWTTALPGETSTEHGFPRLTSQYVTTSDGTRLAVDVWLPTDIAPGEHRPALLRATRYWRNGEFTLLARGLSALGVLPPLGLRDDTSYFTQRGFVVVIADARGTGASEGEKPFPIAPQESADYAEVIDWITLQSWSNGNVGAFGVSYDGMTAEAMAGQGHPALKAIAPTYMVFDSQYYLSTLGGVVNSKFMRDWQALNHGLDANAGLCKPGDNCRWLNMLVSGVREVEGQPVAALAAQRQTPAVLETTEKTPYRNDPLWRNPTLTWRDIASYGRADVIARTDIAIFALAGWLDAGSADGALARLLSLPNNTQEVTIGTLSHGGLHDTDPFKPVAASAEPSRAQQLKQMADFFSHHLAAQGEAPTQRIRYYTLNGGWKESNTWPPSGLAQRVLQFCEDGMLCDTNDAVRPGEVTYAVDFSTTSSHLGRTRWDTPLGGSDVVYEDRRDLSGRRLSFTSPPLPTAMDITGTPVLDLHLASSHADGAVHAYMEHVSADGRVTYVTEGATRLTHARAPSCRTCPYRSDGPNRSFAREHQQPFTPDTLHRITLPLLATSVRFRAGDRLRISLTGADAVQFARTPARGEPRYQFAFGTAQASRLLLPVEATPQQRGGMQ
ncbi:CocE/NonD family hydrolase [Pseudohalioglobus sediminis]|uniref:CocE/NonD family hydrolase n=1 Tax=Pseudohalioglobus sediminis TaxID=2606449 RepID=UPI00165ED237|nr:CocE/NonD family hydrolase [Pseudohalioglobus sediminis]